MEGDLQKESVCCFIVTSNETQDKAIHHTWYWVMSKKFTFQVFSARLVMSMQPLTLDTLFKYQEKHDVRNVGYKI